MRRVLVILLIVWLYPATAPADATDLLFLKKSVIVTYAQLAYASYNDALAGARTLADSIDALVESPSADALTRAQMAWRAARIPYAHTEAFRFYDGPIDSVEGFINSWPIDENLIDYVEGEPDAGVINHPERYPAITTDLIVSLNEHGGEKNITAGYHAIEFLLWGQDFNDTGPGGRSYLDYVDGHRPHADRRRGYLQLTARLLVHHLERVVDDWSSSGPPNYRSRFLAMPPDEALTCILKGLGILSGAELAGERLTVPYETKDQEDEHSCFSDNTQRDIVEDVAGIQDVFLGRHVRANGERIEGRSVRDLLDRVDPALSATLDRQMTASVAAARAVPAPFDRAILGTDAAPGRIAVKTLIRALRAQADAIAKAGGVLGLKLNF